MSVKRISSDTFGSRLRNLLRRCAKSVFGCISSGRLSAVIAAVVLCWFAFETSAGVKPEDLIAVNEIYAGQNYGNMIYYSVLKPFKLKGKYYNLVNEDDFITALGSNKCFLFKWYPKNSSSSKIKVNTDNEGNQFKTYSGKYNNTVNTIENAGLAIYTNSGMPMSILSLFGQSSIDSGFILGVVDSNLKYAYDISDRIDYYNKSSVSTWDGVTYETNAWLNREEPSYVLLDDRGNKMLAEDLAYGIKWIEEKRKIVEATDSVRNVIEKTNVTYKTEQVLVENIEYYYVTNTTVVVNPNFVGLDSVLDFTYPKYSTEGKNAVYIVNRSGLCSDSLTIHVLTNGYFCGNISWKSGESGKKSIRIYYGIDDRFDDNRPMEILIKSLNRKVGTRISEE